MDTKIYYIWFHPTRLYKARTSAEPKSYNTEIALCNWSRKTTYWLRYKARDHQACSIRNLQARAKINCSPFFILFAKSLSLPRDAHCWCIQFTSLHSALIRQRPDKIFWKSGKHYLMRIQFISTTSLYIPNF